MYLLASLPDSFNMLVAALEANEDVPKIEVATERLLHAERKQKEKLSSDSSGEKASHFVCVSRLLYLWHTCCDLSIAVKLKLSFACAMSYIRRFTAKWSKGKRLRQRRERDRLVKQPGRKQKRELRLQQC